MQLKDSDVNHLRRLIGYVRCEIGQSPEDLKRTVRGIAPALGPLDALDEAGKTRLIAAYLRAQAVPAYVRAALAAREMRLAEWDEARDGATLTENEASAGAPAGILADQDAALQALTDQAQALHLGYDPPPPDRS